MNEPLNPYERYEISGLSERQRITLLLQKREQYAEQMDGTREEENIWKKQDIASTAATNLTKI